MSEPRTTHATAITPPLIAFTSTIFLSAGLLFFVQPLYARIVLPILGGAPSVWTTAMLFFQTVLICGYLYGHLMVRHVPARLQLPIHLLLWAVALFSLPLGVPEGWTRDPEANTAAQTLWLFTLGVGLPFAVLSANAPLLQSWYSRTGSEGADDPYFLYAASNLGSLIALLAFPLVAVPLFGVSQISIGFAGAYVVLGIGLFSCGFFARPEMIDPNSNSSLNSARTELDWATVVRCLALAFVPSSLMLAITTELTTDLGSIPLLWVIPLALYLLSFVLAFARKDLVRKSWLKTLATICVVWLSVVFVFEAAGLFQPINAAATILSFFIVAWAAHRALYESRPKAEDLTLFYVVMSLGGALGGLFNSIVAPFLFNTLLEAKVTVVAAAVLVAAAWFRVGTKNVALSLISASAALVIYAIYLRAADPDSLLGVVAPLPVCAGLIVAVTKARIIPAVLAIGVVAAFYDDVRPRSFLFADRSFFGTHWVSDTSDGYRIYRNGSTTHGFQRLSELGAERPTPVSYYHPNGPIAEILLSDFGREADSIGIVGLGTGALACYALPGQDWHFYEIDPVVDRVARDANLFTYITQCTPDAPTYLGDARQVLEDQEAVQFDILIIDAYSSDAVPLHLTTLEAISLYMSRLSQDGLLLFHISNRYFAIDRPLGRAAERLNISAWTRSHRPDRSSGADPANLDTDVVLFSRQPASAEDIVAAEGWQLLSSDGGPVWTDDRANALSILKGFGG